MGAYGPQAPTHLLKFKLKGFMSQLFQCEGKPVNGGMKVCLATTSYDSPDASYTFSMARSREYLSEHGIPNAYYLLQGNCHVDDARNLIVKEFLESDCTHLIFIDADVSWQKWELLRLCQHPTSMHIVGGVYPFRRRTKFTSGNMPVRMKLGETEPDENGILEVEGIPSGFMRLSRWVLERLEMDAQKHWNKDDRTRMIPILFERTFDDGIRWGGDLAFCNKARDYNFKVYADCDIVLGHTGKEIHADSLGGALRRQTNSTLRHIAKTIADGKETMKTYTEGRNYIDNPYGALEDLLAVAVLQARKAEGPIIEAGTGLTSIVMAAANPDQTVFCLEHDPVWAERFKEMVYESGVKNIGLCMCPLKDGWYDLSDVEDELPERFALALCDGPPRALATRAPFFDRFPADVILVDDADTPNYKEWVEDWCKKNDKPIAFVERMAIINGNLMGESVEV